MIIMQSQQWKVQRSRSLLSGMFGVTVSLNGFLIACLTRVPLNHSIFRNSDGVKLNTSVLSYDPNAVVDRLAGDRLEFYTHKLIYLTLFPVKL